MIDSFKNFDLFNAMKKFPFVDYITKINEPDAKGESFLSDTFFKTIKSTMHKQKPMDYDPYKIKANLSNVPSTRPNLRSMEFIRFADPRLETAIQRLTQRSTNTDFSRILAKYSGTVTPNRRTGRRTTGMGSPNITRAGSRSLAKFATPSKLGTASKREVT